MADEDPEYCAWLRRQPCLWFDYEVCNGGIEVHHDDTEFARGKGLRAHDHEAIPMCNKHHRDWHDGRAPFDADRVFKRLFMRLAIGHMRLRWSASHAQRHNLQF